MKPGPIIDHIVGWLSSYCDQAGMNGFVVGVSGGIDSAVTACIAAEAFGPTNVWASYAHVHAVGTPEWVKPAVQTEY